MTIQEFKKQLDYIEFCDNYDYTGGRKYIYIYEDLISCDWDDGFRLKRLDGIKYIIAIGIYRWQLYGYMSFCYKTLGFFNNEYEPTTIYFGKWKLEEIIFDSVWDGLTPKPSLKLIYGVDNMIFKCGFENIQENKSMVYYHQYYYFSTFQKLLNLVWSVIGNSY